MSLNSSIASLLAKLNTPSIAAVILHVLIGTFLVSHLGTHFAYRHVLMAYVALAAAKEFLWDTRFEIPPQSEEGAGRDFLGWVLGGIVALGLHSIGW